MKEEIVGEAIRLFLQYGFKSVTMDEIAQQMRISKKTIYTHFETKETLVEAAVLTHHGHIMDRIKTISKQAKDPIIELYQLKKEALNHLSNEDNSPQYQLQKFYPSIYQKVRAQEFEILGSSFSNSLKKGIEMGLFRAEVDIDFVTRIYFNGIQGVTNIELFPLAQYKIDKLLVLFSEYHLRAICSPLGIEKLEKYKKEFNR
ncbi:MAG: TetR/AcrR family transcriptional regulator [Flavobacteriaceae bacterium]|jgi:AcrR family transcriptional regulator